MIANVSTASIANGLATAAPKIDRELLIEQTFSAIMKLPEDRRKAIHNKYLERYGWHE